MGDKRIVWITWVDSAQIHGWADDEGVINSMRDGELKECLSVGIVLHESELSITLASTVSTRPNQSAGAITIPKVAIKEQFEIIFV